MFYFSPLCINSGLWLLDLIPLFQYVLLFSSLFLFVAVVTRFNTTATLFYFYPLCINSGLWLLDFLIL